ncbi:MAG: cytochrome c1 [Methylococcaceae bacterium]|jgi:ubiquinol-cytochrome c reductase cytochrome c1 subunit|nr:cytochrome c1 [Methylococcaceae bacterium]
MKKALTILLMCGLSFVCRAESGSFIKQVDVDVFDQLSVIRGAGYFANYCLGCHGLKQIRYSRIANDLKINEAQLRETFLFGDAKIHESVHTAMTAESAAISFGVAPPDLSLVIRSRGADWVYSYLRGFYTDTKRPFGVNNLLVPNVAMPNVLWELQGPQEAVLDRVDGKLEIVGVKSSGRGKLTEREFDHAVNDLVNFLAYVAEPSTLQRIPLGKYVIVFLLFLTYIFYRLKQEYWKDID